MNKITNVEFIVYSEVILFHIKNGKIIRKKNIKDIIILIK